MRKAIGPTGSLVINGRAYLLAQRTDLVNSGFTLFLPTKTGFSQPRARTHLPLPDGFVTVIYLAFGLGSMSQKGLETEFVTPFA